MANDSIELCVCRSFQGLGQDRLCHVEALEDHRHFLPLPLSSFNFNYLIDPHQLWNTLEIPGYKTRNEAYDPGYPTIERDRALKKFYNNGSLGTYSCTAMIDSDKEKIDKQ